jgi:hypothetical protein
MHTEADVLGRRSLDATAESMIRTKARRRIKAIIYVVRAKNRAVVALNFHSARIINFAVIVLFAGHCRSMASGVHCLLDAEVFTTQDPVHQSS